MKLAEFTRVTGLLLSAAVACAQALAAEPPPTQPRVVTRPRGKDVVSPNKVARPSGALRIQDYSWDFGNVPQDVQVSHRFTVENVGQDTLFLERIEPT